MNFNFEPNYTVLAFLFAKKFLFPELLAVLALLRLFLGHGRVRVTALIALALSLWGVFTVFAPALGLHGLAIAQSGARLMILGSGMIAMLVPAVFLLSGALSRNRPAAWIEILAFLATIGLVGLWIATMF